jgi:hypothetical protein
MRTTIPVAVICMSVAGMALAQTTLNRTQEQEAVKLITDVGATCERVVRTQTIGQVDDSTTLMAVACAGGEEERYVLQLNNLGEMAWYATCENLAKGTQNQVRCFR